MLHLGDPAPLTPGLAFSRTFSMPSGFSSGMTQWVQVFDHYEGGGQLIDTSNYDFNHSGLDDIYPYDTHNNTDDSPAFQLRSDVYLSQFANYTANMWLMFKPGGLPGTAIWVPLKWVTWSWAAAASFNGSQWVMTSHTDPSGLTDEDTDECPEWTRRAQDP